MPEPEPVPCRLSVILAREAPVGVIFRRGPSKLVELIKWHTDTDTFERGQWFKGRIYEQRSDLSPDGSKLIYFAAKLNRRTLKDPAYFPAWTAISRPPGLTAVALWPAKYIWPEGGGFFQDDGTVWLNHLPESAAPHADHKPVGLRVIPNPDMKGTAWYVFPKRLVRDGWVLRDEGWMRRDQRPAPERPLAVWTRDDPHKRWTLVMKGYVLLRWAIYAMRDASGGREFPIENAEWADWDRQGRLVFTRYGKLFAGDLEQVGRMVQKELADFNADTFEAKEAPAWAREW